MSWRALRSHATIAGIPAATRRRRGQERFYVGRRGERPEVYVVTLRDVQRLRPPGQRTDTALEWGREAERGGAELALAILCHTTGREPPEWVCTRFRDEVVASLPSAGFVVGCDDVALWLAAEQRDPETWRRAISPSVGRSLADVLAVLGAPFTRQSDAGRPGS